MKCPNCKQENPKLFCLVTSLNEKNERPPYDEAPDDYPVSLMCRECGETASCGTKANVEPVVDWGFFVFREGQVQGIEKKIRERFEYLVNYKSKDGTNEYTREEAIIRTAAEVLYERAGSGLFGGGLL